MSTTAQKRGVAATPAPDWRARYDALVAGLRQEGAQQAIAREGGWWLLLGEMIAGGVAADFYEATAVLGRLHIREPEFPKHTTRWTRFRNGDEMSPGTNARQPRPAPWPERFSWSPDADHAPPPVTRARSPSAEDVLRAWHAAHGLERVAMQDIARPVVDLLAVTTPSDAAVRLRRFANAPLGGIAFRVREAAGGPPSFGLERSISAEPMEPVTTRDPAMQRWADRHADLVNHELEYGIGSGAAANGEARRQEAAVLAFEQVAVEFAEESANVLSAARSMLAKQGLDPRHPLHPMPAELQPPRATRKRGWDGLSTAQPG